MVLQSPGIGPLLLRVISSFRLLKVVISRVIVRVTPFRVLITLLITYLLSPLPLQVLGTVTGDTSPSHNSKS